MHYLFVASMKYFQYAEHGNGGLDLFSVNSGVHSKSILFLICLAMLLGLTNHLHILFYK